MFKLSMTETNGQRRLVLEGKLVRPWTEEVESTWRTVRNNSKTRKLVIDLTNVTLISRDGENTLLNLMREGASLTGEGVLTKHLLRQLARRCRCQPQPGLAQQDADQEDQ